MKFNKTPVGAVAIGIFTLCDLAMANDPPSNSLPFTSSSVTVVASAETASYLREAIDEVISIMLSRQFADQVAEFAQMDLATAADPTCETVKPLRVLEEMRKLTPFDLKSRQSILHWGSNAAASACGPVAVNTRRIKKWDVSSVKVIADRIDRRAELINTLAHEMTHVISKGSCDPAEKESRYLDEGHGKCVSDGNCNDAFLVSYVWGDFVECAFRVKHNDTADFRACVLNQVNGFEEERASLSFSAAEGSASCRKIAKWPAKSASPSAGIR